MSLQKIIEDLELLRIEATNNWLGQDGKSIVVAKDFKDAEVGLEAVITELNAYIARLESDKGEVSDGYHTFNELYEHRHALFANLVKLNPNTWKSKLHDDGTMFDGWFIAGIELKEGVITYHIPLRLWDLFRCQEIEKSPKWDGHSSNDVVERLAKEAVNVIKESQCSTNA